MATVEILKRSREKLTPPGAWTQGQAAKNSYGYRVPSASPAACQWCMLGAIWSECDTKNDELDTVLRFQAATGIKLLAEWNDTPDRTHAEVLDAFDKAILALESQGG